LALRRGGGSRHGRGREGSGRELFEVSMEEVLRRGEGVGLDPMRGLGAALQQTRPIREGGWRRRAGSEHLEEQLFYTWGLVEMVEAAARSVKGSAQRALIGSRKATRACGHRLGRASRRATSDC